MHRKLLLVLCLFLFWGLTPKCQTVGVIDYTEEVQDGFVLFAPSGSKSTFLIDPCGAKVNEWESTAVPGLMARLDSKGSLIRSQRVNSSTFNGGGSGGKFFAQTWEGFHEWVISLNQDSFHAHHDFEILPNGNLLVLGWEFISVAKAKSNGRAVISNKGMWSEVVKEIQVLGDESFDVIWEWHAWDHLIQDVDTALINYGVIADHPEKINLNYPGGSINLQEDWTHANGIDYNETLDQIIINIRNFNEFWIVDHSTTTEQASTDSGGNAGKGGDILYRWGNPSAYNMGDEKDIQLFRQHDAHWIKEDSPLKGKILVFNNGMNRPEGDYSTVDLISPPLSGYNYVLKEGTFGPDTSITLYGDMLPDEFFYSNRISGSQMLKNGNLLICIGNEGQFLEVNENREVVWNYINPVGFNISIQGEPPSPTNSVFQVVKYYSDFPGFEGRDLTGGDKIEINPFDNCTLTDVAEPTLKESSSLLVNTLIHNSISLNKLDKHEWTLYLYDMTGQLIRSIKTQENIVYLDDIPSGLYVLKIDSEQGFFETSKVYITNE